jgi:membrane dipeptidase
MTSEPAWPVASFLRDALVWDNIWPLEPDAGNDYPRLAEFKAAGWNAISLTVAGDNHSIGSAFQRVASAKRRIGELDYCVLAETADDVEQAAATNRLAVLMHFEGTRCFERDLDVVEPFFDLGIRHTLLAFNSANSAGGGCAEKEDGGLTRFGRRLVAEMERVGMLLDLSHTGCRTSLEALDAATRPTVFSHSNAHAVAKHFRNVTDEQIQACARTGGLIGLSGSSGYLGERYATPQAMFRHVDHIVQLVGIEHVGLGLDIVFDADALNAWVRSRPDEWPGTDSPDWPGFSYAQPSQLGELVDLMLANGYTELDVRKFLGENYMRIARLLWS